MSESEDGPGTLAGLAELELDDATGEALRLPALPPLMTTVISA